MASCLPDRGRCLRGFFPWLSSHSRSPCGPFADGDEERRQRCRRRESSGFSALAPSSSLAERFPSTRGGLQPPGGASKAPFLGLWLQAKARAGRTIRLRDVGDLDLAFGFAVCLTGPVGSLCLAFFSMAVCVFAQAKNLWRSKSKSAATAALASRTSWTMGSFMTGDG